MTKFKFCFMFALVFVFIVNMNIGRAIWVPIVNKVKGKRSISDAISSYEKVVERRLEPIFKNAGVIYPPAELALLGVKEDEVIELWARGDDQNWTLIWGYPILVGSGVLGPKLREGDLQIPEGVYGLEYLNPNSAFHLSMKINYPNEFDKKWAEIEGRAEPGSDIFIHGKDVSVGCLAVGDEAIQELFVLAAKIGLGQVRVIISPVDPRKKDLVMPDGSADWVGDLYENIKVRFLEVARK